jgi:hypothetical protein
MLTLPNEVNISNHNIILMFTKILTSRLVQDSIKRCQWQAKHPASKTSVQTFKIQSVKDFDGGKVHELLRPALESDLLLTFKWDVRLDIYLQKSFKYPNSKFQTFTVKLIARVVQSIQRPDYGLKIHGIIVQLLWDARDLSLFQCIQSESGAHPVSYPMALSLTMVQPRLKGDHTPHLVSRLKMRWGNTSTPHTSLHICTVATTPLLFCC